jgi:hypothetical protein
MNGHSTKWVLGQLYEHHSNGYKNVGSWSILSNNKEVRVVQHLWVVPSLKLLSSRIFILFRRLEIQCN